MRNAGLDEAQAEIKISGRTTNSHGYADDTTLMAESEEELKSLLVKVKQESGKAGLKINIQINKQQQKTSTFRKRRSWHPVPSFHSK